MYKSVNGKVMNVLISLPHLMIKRHVNFVRSVLQRSNKEVKLLEKGPSDWENYDSKSVPIQSTKYLKVTNDCPEKGVALIKKFNSTITLTENQKKFFLHTVEYLAKPTEKKSSSLKRVFNDQVTVRFKCFHNLRKLSFWVFHLNFD